MNVADLFVGLDKDGRVAFWGRGGEVVFDNVDFVSLGLRQSDVDHGVGDTLRGIVHSRKSCFEGLSLQKDIESSRSRLGDDMEVDLHGER